MSEVSRGTGGEKEVLKRGREATNKLVARCTKIQLQLEELKKPLKTAQAKAAARKVVREAEESVELVEKELSNLAEAAAPFGVVADGGEKSEGTNFLAGILTEGLAEAIQDVYLPSKKPMTLDDLFAELAGSPSGNISEEKL